MERHEAEKQAALLKDALGRLEIEAVATDLDDFLCETREEFGRRMMEFTQMVERVFGVSKDRVWKRLECYNNAMYKQFAVNPKRWTEVMRLMAEDIGVSYDYLSTLGGPIFESIYTTPVIFKAGAEDLLRIFSMTGLPLAILTHANEAWTWRKYEWLGLGRFLSRERIFIASEDEFKGPRHWLMVSKALGIPIGKMIVGGDSLPGDIRAGLVAGAKYAFWLSLTNGWVMYNHGEIPAGAVKMKEPYEMVEKLLSMKVQ